MTNMDVLNKTLHYALNTGQIEIREITITVDCKIINASRHW